MERQIKSLNLNQKNDIDNYIHLKKIDISRIREKTLVYGNNFFQINTAIIEEYKEKIPIIIVKYSFLIFDQEIIMNTMFNNQSGILKKYGYYLSQTKEEINVIYYNEGYSLINNNLFKIYESENVSNVKYQAINKKLFYLDIICSLLQKLSNYHKMNKNLIFIHPNLIFFNNEKHFDSLIISNKSKEKDKKKKEFGTDKNLINVGQLKRNFTNTKFMKTKTNAIIEAKKNKSTDKMVEVEKKENLSKPINQLSPNSFIIYDLILDNLITGSKIKYENKNVRKNNDKINDFQKKATGVHFINQNQIDKKELVKVTTKRNLIKYKENKVLLNYLGITDDVKLSEICENPALLNSLDCHNAVLLLIFYFSEINIDEGCSLNFQKIQHLFLMDFYQNDTKFSNLLKYIKNDEEKDLLREILNLDPLNEDYNSHHIYTRLNNYRNNYLSTLQCNSCISKDNLNSDRVFNTKVKLKKEICEMHYKCLKILCRSCSKNHSCKVCTLFTKSSDLNLDHKYEEIKKTNIYAKISVKLTLLDNNKSLFETTAEELATIDETLKKMIQNVKEKEENYISSLNWIKSYLNKFLFFIKNRVYSNYTQNIIDENVIEELDKLLENQEFIKLFTFTCHNLFTTKINKLTDETKTYYNKLLKLIHVDYKNHLNHFYNTIFSYYIKEKKDKNEDESKQKFISKFCKKLVPFNSYHEEFHFFENLILQNINYKKDIIDSNEFYKKSIGFIYENNLFIEYIDTEQIDVFLPSINSKILRMNKYFSSLNMLTKLFVSGGIKKDKISNNCFLIEFNSTPKLENFIKKDDERNFNNIMKSYENQNRNNNNAKHVTSMTLKKINAVNNKNEKVPEGKKQFTKNIYSLTKNITILPKMNSGRYKHSTVQINQYCILVIGGKNTNTCEIFNFLTNKWIYSAELSNKRYYINTCVVNEDTVYAFNGIKDEKISETEIKSVLDNTIEKFNFRNFFNRIRTGNISLTEKWEKVEYFSNESNFLFCGLISSNKINENKIYFLGGRRIPESFSFIHNYKTINDEYNAEYDELLKLIWNINSDSKIYEFDLNRMEFNSTDTSIENNDYEQIKNCPLFLSSFTKRIIIEDNNEVDTLYNFGFVKNEQFQNDSFQLSHKLYTFKNI
jgi:hypothetical protein